MIRVPVISFDEITEEDFVERARAFVRVGQPLYSMWQIVYRASFSGQRHPGVVIGLEPRDGGWVYHLCEADQFGKPSRTLASEKDVSA